MSKIEIKNILQKYGLKLDKEKLKGLELISESRKDDLLHYTLQNFLIGESYFFRDRQTWKTLKAYLSNSRNRRINFISLGCSKGEEVYNFCFLAEDLGLKYIAVGIDADPKRIKQARQGIYNYWSVRMLNINELRKYFIETNNKWKVKDVYKRYAKFETGNILELEMKNKRFDVVMIRKVLIYFDSQSIKNVVRKIDEILKDDGILILGRGEYHTQLDKFFEPLILDKSVFWVKRKKKSPLIKSPNIFTSKTHKPKIKRTVAKGTTRIENHGTHIEEQKFVIEKLIEEEKYEEVLKTIEVVLKKHQNSHHLWKYKAIAEMSLNKIEDAKKSLEKAIFLNPEDRELWYLKQLLMR